MEGIILLSSASVTPPTQEKQSNKQINILWIIFMMKHILRILKSQEIEDN